MTAIAPTRNELADRSTEPMVRARWARRGETGAAAPSPSCGRVRRLMRRETRLLAAPSTSRWIARCSRKRAISASRTVRAIVNDLATMMSADCARKSLSVHW